MTNEGRSLDSRDLFISHASEDDAPARELRAALEAAGYTCWMAPDDVVGNNPWAEQILQAIEATRVMIVLISRSANDSIHVSREVNLALGHGRPILPIRVEGVAPGGSLEYLLSLVQRVDAFPPPVADHMPRVQRMVDSLLRTARAPDVPTVDPTGIPPVTPQGSPPGRNPLALRAATWAQGNRMLVALSIVAAVAIFVAAAVIGSRGPGSSPAPSSAALASASQATPPSASPTPTPTATPSATPAATGTAVPPPTPSLVVGNRPPVANDDAFTWPSSNATYFDVPLVDNDADADAGALLHYYDWEQPDIGKILGAFYCAYNTSKVCLRYETGGKVGPYTATFTYRIADQQGAISNRATARITFSSP